jgi:hypothetical protein
MGMNADQRETEIDQAFGAWLKSMRTGQRLTTSELHRLTDINPIRIKQIESGVLIKGTTRPECEAIARAFGLSVTEVCRRAAGTFPELPTPCA